MKASEERVQQLPHLVRLLMLLTAAVVLVLVVVLTKLYGPPAASTPVVVEDEATQGPPPAGSYHRPATPAPDTALIPRTAAGRQIRYGRELIANTAQYLGPQGSVLPKSVSESRIRGNADVQDWALSAADVRTLSTLSAQCRMVHGGVFLSPAGPYRTLKDLWDTDE